MAMGGGREEARGRVLQALISRGESMLEWIPEAERVFLRCI